MSANGKVEAYFTGVAATYQSASKGGLWNMVRQREADRYMALVGDVRGRDLLELGCGAGFYTRLLLAKGARHIWGVDLSQRMLDELPREGVTPLLGDATAVDPGRRFDLMVSAGMLEFVPDAGAALRHAASLANPDAAFFILYPTLSLFGRAYQRFHRRNGLSITLFDTAGMRHMAKTAGWRLDEVRAAGPYSACARLVRV
jgi:SAM-dependent methyltransferase